MTTQEFQQAFGITLPAAYVARQVSDGGDSRSSFLVDSKYAEYNKEYTYPFATAGEIQIASLLYLNASSKSQSMPAELEVLRRFRELPSQFFPIAVCWNGDYLLCDIRHDLQQTKDNLFYWDHESGRALPVGTTLDDFYFKLVMKAQRST